MSLVPLGTRGFYLPGANNLGLVANDAGEAVAIDTGIDKDTGRALKKAAEAAGLRIVAIVSTHHHADHIGGNDFLLRNLPGIEVWAPAAEAPLISNPELEPTCLYGGARAPQALRGKWLLSKGSLVHHQLPADAVTIAGITFDVLEVPGHSPGQVAVAADGTCFAADCCFGIEVIAKHGVPFGYDIRQQQASISKLGTTEYQRYLPAHGSLIAAAELHEALIVPNLAAIARAQEAVLGALAEPTSLPSIVSSACQALSHTLAGIPQYYLFSTTVAAYLSWLEAEGLAVLEFASGEPRWRRA